MAMHQSNLLKLQNETLTPTNIGITSKKTNKPLSGLVSAADISAVEYKQLKLTGDLKKDFNRLYSDSKIMVWGGPGNGKTVKLLKYAQEFATAPQDFAESGMKTLYVAHEELKRSTLKEKIIEFNIGAPNLFFTKDLLELESSGKSLSDFDVAIFDSINSLGMKLDDAKKMFDEFPGKIFFLIVQSIKDGNFRGGQEWEHEVDIAGEVKKRNLRIRKNRLDADFIDKAEAAEKKDLVEKAVQKEIVKNEAAKLAPKKAVATPKKKLLANNAKNKVTDQN